MEKLKELQAKHQQLTDDILAMSEDAENFDDEKQAKYDALVADAESFLKQIENIEKAMVQKQKATAMADKKPVDTGRVTPPDLVDTKPLSNKKDVVIPASVRRGDTLKTFGTEEKAYSFGQFLRATIFGSQTAKDWCADHGINATSQTEGSNTAGGYLVPIQFSNEIIKLVNQYGVFRQNVRVRPMTSDTLYVPRRSTGLTAYAVGEAAQGTESNKTWDQVELIARKWMVLATMSNELAEDAIINIADDLAWEIGYAFATKEDQCGFIGDGTSTYNGITGVNVAIKAAAGSPTTTSAGGVVVANENVMSAVNLTSHNAVIATCPDYAMNGAKWYCSPYYFAAVMQRLAYAAGGNTTGDIMGGTGRSFLGYPVVLSNVFPSTDTNSQILCLFGRLDLAASMGDRRMMEIAMSTEATINSKSLFEYDLVGIRGTQRYDINAHDVGSTTAAGPIVALQALNA